MKLSLVFAFLISFPTIMLAQQDFRPGFIITHAGDTVPGMVNFTENERAFRICEFRRGATASAEKLGPDEISGYGYTADKVFISLQTGEIKNRQPSLPDGTYFFEILVEGALDLYKFDKTYLIRDRQADFYQLYNTTGDIVLTDDSDPYQRPEDRNYYQEKKEYIGLLKFATQDCSSLKFEGIRFRELDITKTVKKYNQCTGEPYVIYKDNKPWLKININAEAGVLFSSLKINKDVQKYVPYLKEKFDASISLTPALLFDISAPRLSERTYLQVGIQYLNNTYRSHFIEDNGYTVRESDFTLEMEDLKIPVSIRHDIPGEKISTFFSVGVSSTVNLSYTNQWILDEQYADGTSRYEENPSILPMKNSQFGIYTAVGGLMDFSPSLQGYLRLSFEITNGVVATNIYDNTLSKSKIINLQLSTGIRL